MLRRHTLGYWSRWRIGRLGAADIARLNAALGFVMGISARLTWPTSRGRTIPPRRGAGVAGAIQPPVPLYKDRSS
jgi:hypothetical protein